MSSDAPNHVATAPSDPTTGAADTDGEPGSLAAAGGADFASGREVIRRC